MGHIIHSLLSGAQERDLARQTAPSSLTLTQGELNTLESWGRGGSNSSSRSVWLSQARSTFSSHVCGFISLGHQDSKMYSRVWGIETKCAPRPLPAETQAPAETLGSRDVSWWAGLAQLGCVCLWTMEVKLESKPHGTPEVFRDHRRETKICHSKVAEKEPRDQLASCRRLPVV